MELHTYVCPDCNHPVGRNAAACPHCGAVFAKSHGVFFYVFWGVISLFVTLAIIAAVVLVTGIAGAGYVASRVSAEEKKAPSTNAVPEAPEPIPRDAIRVYDFTARMFDTYSGNKPGVSFKIRNVSDRTIKRISLTVYFMDASGTVIQEEDYHPVNTDRFSDNAPLKPGYIWQLEDGKFYTAERVPSEWQPGRARYDITKVEFQK